MNYGITLINLREKYNLTQKEIAKVLNISNSLYSRYEKEIQIIPIEHLNTLSNYYNVSIDYLFNFNKEIYKDNKEEIDIYIAGNRLKEFRKNNKITQEKLALLLNTTHSVISEYEHGKKLISTPFLYAICKKYNISADYLLGKTNLIKINI